MYFRYWIYRPKYNWGMSIIAYKPEREKIINEYYNAIGIVETNDGYYIFYYPPVAIKWMKEHKNEDYKFIK